MAGKLAHIIRHCPWLESHAVLSHDGGGFLCGVCVQLESDGGQGVMGTCRACPLTQWTVLDSGFISHCVISAQPALTKFTETIVSLKCQFVRVQLVSTVFMVVGEIKEFRLPSPLNFFFLTALFHVLQFSS